MSMLGSFASLLSESFEDSVGRSGLSSQRSSVVVRKGDINYICVLSDLTRSWQSVGGGSVAELGGFLCWILTIVISLISLISSTAGQDEEVTLKSPSTPREVWHVTARE